MNSIKTQHIARRRYRREYLVREECRACDGGGELDAGSIVAVKCPACAGRGSIARLRGPGFRAWARANITSAPALSPKLAAVVGSRRAA